MEQGITEIWEWGFTGLDREGGTEGIWKASESGCMLNRDSSHGSITFMALALEDSASIISAHSAIMTAALAIP